MSQSLLEMRLGPSSNDCDEHTDSADQADDVDGDDEALIPQEMRDRTFEAKFDSNKSDRGRLYVGRGKSRYINNDKADQV